MLPFVKRAYFFVHHFPFYLSSLNFIANNPSSTPSPRLGIGDFAPLTSVSPNVLGVMCLTCGVALKILPWFASEKSPLERRYLSLPRLAAEADIITSLSNDSPLHSNLSAPSPPDCRLILAE